ncbi:PLC-like phosphodiesterase [Gonapodya prolifera JEL478]|uniref:glycerophosphodiester phosphodiesterase n=1 Tax=Gonapodya prolifera (strain JEL478) TaxID=1344416 RepID=A0A139A3H5_GONPJ|nr:PLC-like phosphodiesterase [Gonapodya prolifera JEL478]|eukprot:KXS11352.1 PLC-like phosphodiesterase [Gonapodya prolifera JEL478]
MKVLAALAAASVLAAADAWIINPTSPTFGAVAKDKVWPKASKGWKTLDGSPSFSACHRGSRWHLPEESAGAYWEGALSNCDWNEPDVVWTKDGVAVVSHDSFADSAVTSVGTDPYFAGKNRTVCSLFEDQYLCRNLVWYGDLNSSEVKQLYPIQNPARTYPKGYRPPFYDSTFKILSFQEFIDTNVNVSTKINTTLGLIPELKQPFYTNTQVLNKVDEATEKKFRAAYFNLTDGIDPAYNHSAEDTFMAILKKNGLPSARNPIVVQCFEYETIQYLARKYPNGSGFNALLFLLDINWWALTPKGMDRIAALQKETNNTIYVGPWKDSLYDGIYLYALSASAGYGIDFLNATANPDLQYPGYKVTDIVDPAVTVQELHKRGLGYLGYTYYDSRQDPLYNCVDPTGYDNITETLSKLWYTPKPCPKNKRHEFFDQFAMGVDGFFVENNNEFAQLRDEYNNLLLATTKEDGDYFLNLYIGLNETGVRVVF